ncbi:MAG: hypothetical protein V4643_06695 [Bacteroidota bacterium]
MNNFSTSFLIIVVSIAASIGLIYYLLPKFNLGRYGAAFLKTAIAWSMIAYIIFDLSKKESYGLITILVLGAVAFAYTAFIAKRKD